MEIRHQYGFFLHYTADYRFSITVSNYGSLAQLVEQLTFNQLVAGSNPARPTIFCHCPDLK
jgi:hypothetical protein